MRADAWSRIKEGFDAGARAGAILAALDRAERAVLRGTPVYAPERIARRLSTWVLRDPLPPAGARRVGLAMRSAYAPLLGALTSLLVPRPRRPSRHSGRATWGTVIAGVFAAGAIAGAEMIVLPSLGATPPPSRWRRAEQVAFAVHTLAFGLVTTARLRG